MEFEVDLTRSVVGSSDVIHDFSCSPCAEDGRNNEAVNYCVKCDTYFCETCVAHHNKVFKSHQLLDKQVMTSAARQMKQGKVGLSLPAADCAEHPGNTVQMFCGTHAVCCCTICIALGHRECKDVDFIPKLAKGILRGKERETVKSSLEKARGELLQMKSEREAKLSELKNSKEDILEEIQLDFFCCVIIWLCFKVQLSMLSFRSIINSVIKCLGIRECKDVDFIPKLAKGILRGKERETVKSSLEKARGELLQMKSEREAKLSELKKTKEDILEEIQQMKESIIVRVNELERKSRHEVCEEFEKIAGELISHIDSLNDLLKSTETQIKSIDQKQGNVAEAFVAVRNGRKLESTCNSLLQRVKQGHIKELEFAANVDIETLLTNLETLGTVTIMDYTTHAYSAKLTGEYDVKVKEDESICRIYDVCILDDDQYIITDYNNNKIKRLDKTFKVTDLCEMQGPWGVCKTHTNEFAVTLCDNGQVQLVSDKPKIKCTRRFEVGLYCRGIACQYNKLIISCGSRGSQGEVRIYDLSGLLLDKYTVDAQGKPMFSFISHIVINSDESLIHLADDEEGLVTFDRKANRSSVCTDQSLKTPFGLCTDDHGNFFLSGRTSHNVIQLDRHGTLVQEILKESDGIRLPISVTFATNPRRLITACFNSNTVNVFKLT